MQIILVGVYMMFLYKDVGLRGTSTAINGPPIGLKIRKWPGHPFEGNRKPKVVSFWDGFSSTGVPKPAHAKPFARRTWLQRRVPQCPMCGVTEKTDYATPGAAYERVDPAHRGVKLVRRWYAHKPSDNTINLLQYSKWVGTEQFRSSTEHHTRVSGNASPHSEPCFCYELGLKWECIRHAAVQ